jgi:predicted small lipoprotein YifL
LTVIFEREVLDMKKTLALVMVLVLALAIAACGGNGSETTVPSTAPTTEPTTVPTTEPTTVPTTEPAPTASVGGIDLTGMTLEEAKAAMTEAAASYKLSLTVNGKPLSFTAEELGLKLDDAALAALLDAVANGSEGSNAVFTYDRDALKGLLKGALNTAPTNATVSYDSSKGKFVANNGTNGTQTNTDTSKDNIQNFLHYWVSNRFFSFLLSIT